jgi:hypothetical protein
MMRVTCGRKGCGHLRAIHRHYGSSGSTYCAMPGCGCRSFRRWPGFRVLLARWAAAYQQQMDRLTPEEQAEYLRRQKGGM